MGIIFSFFKKKAKPTKDILTDLQQKIEELQSYKQSTEARRKRLVGSLVVYSMALYLITAVVYYFYYLPPTFDEKLKYAIPFAAFPPIVYGVKRFLSWYYSWKVNRNETKLSTYKEEKEKILDQVMETETYKVAKDILETFAPEKIKRTIIVKSPTPSRTGHKAQLSSQGMEIRRREIAAPTPQSLSQRTPRNLNSSSPYGGGRSFTSSLQQDITPSPIPPTPSSRLVYNASISNTPDMNTYQRRPPDPILTLDITRASNPEQPPGPPMPRPVLPRERGYLDRFVEYLVGDGPSNRYALICSKCESHNGMALRDEFPYLAFRCAYCHYWNPAKKQRPTAPKLEPVKVQQLLVAPTDEEESDTNESDFSESADDLIDLLEDSSSSSGQTTVSNSKPMLFREESAKLISSKSEEGLEQRSKPTKENGKKEGSNDSVNVTQTENIKQSEKEVHSTSSGHAQDSSSFDSDVRSANGEVDFSESKKSSTNDAFNTSD